MQVDALAEYGKYGAFPVTDLENCRRCKRPIQPYEPRRQAMDFNQSVMYVVHPECENNPVKIEPLLEILTGHDRASRILADLKYKQGWTLALESYPLRLPRGAASPQDQNYRFYPESTAEQPYLDLHNQYELRIKFHAPNTDEHAWKEDFSPVIRFMVPWYRFKCDDDFLNYCFAAILEVEIHEAREFFKYKGLKAFDPHVDGPYLKPKNALTDAFPWKERIIAHLTLGETHE